MTARSLRANAMTSFRHRAALFLLSVALPFSAAAKDVTMLNVS
jgi:hypothetical protein